jgi:hypothetical protein
MLSIPFFNENSKTRFIFGVKFIATNPVPHPTIFSTLTLLQTNCLSFRALISWDFFYQEDSKRFVSHLRSYPQLA